MKTKVGVPIVIIAVVCLGVLLILMGKMFLKGPESTSTPPPSWIDATTGKPKGAPNGSGAPNSGGTPVSSGMPGSGGR